MRTKRYTQNFTGQTVLITGAAGGIGREAALRIYKGGGKVVLVDVNEKALKQVASECGSAMYGVIDLSKEESVESLAMLSAAVGDFTTVLANAGIAAESPLIGGDDSLFMKTIMVNVMGSYYTARGTLPYMKPGGYIMFTSSAAALAVFPAMVAYAVSKAAVAVMAKGFRIELRGKGIKVGLAYYAQLDTAMTDGFNSPAAKWLLGRRGLRVLHRVVPIDRAMRILMEGVHAKKRTISIPGRIKALLLLSEALQWVLEPWFGNVEKGLEISRADIERKRRQETVNAPQ